MAVTTILHTFDHQVPTTKVVVIVTITFMIRMIPITRVYFGTRAFCGTQSILSRQLGVVQHVTSMCLTDLLWGHIVHESRLLFPKINLCGNMSSKK